MKMILVVLSIVRQMRERTDSVEQKMLNPNRVEDGPAGKQGKILHLFIKKGMAGDC